MELVIDKLIDRIRVLSNPTVVGLDPQLDFIPAKLKEEAFAAHGATPKAVAEAFLVFNKAIIDAVSDLVPAVKPQVAMYERYGVEGVRCFGDTVAYAKAKGLIVIGDCKRGDIASSAEGYSNGHIGEIILEGEKYRPFNEDFITINPYLGYDSVSPFLKDCEMFGAGLFVLVKTSNPHGGQIQDLIADGEPVYRRVGQLVSQWGEGLVGRHGYSSVGAVVGATYPRQAAELRRQMPHTFFLVPGYGAQGGKAEDLAVCFDRDGAGAIVNSSRGIIAAYRLDAYKTSFSEEQFALAARQAVIDMRDDIIRFLPN